ncbi:LRR receptor-like serine/threonine-protein kinase GSO1 [Prunus yedoensis var. nudiflora]|uniref:LRR receptor-like serine/threonine-protein kinase GSO1 n=1 Tax=Prunus yedoensis var. nudiflora TaxID=2094558 RepID=A0A314Y9L6_PRUYE|nr:LRR receptor-like serine/threonine-protein kinase GSO1 [Prunus yedoensis var. nudiflora]
MKGDGRCLKLFLALLILFLQNVKGGEVGHNHSHSHSCRDAKVTVRCIERERQALLAFKRGLVDEFNQLSTWGSEAEKQDCCRWEGVYCSNQTGHVIQLDLGYSFPGKMIQHDIFEYSFQGKMISPKLIELHHLQYLDLASIDFIGTQLPNFIGSLTNLRYLNLSSCNLVGQIPSSFGNLTQLQHLDLRYNQLQLENLNWLPAPSSLTYLDLSGANLNTVLNLSLINFNGSQFPDFIGSLTNLRYLSLSSCNLVGQIPSSFGNLTQLQHLDLNYNHELQPENLNWLPALYSLTYLDLASIDFNESQIPDFIGSLTNLRYLSLSSCHLVGQIPSSFRNLTQLQHLDLNYNQLQAENLNWLPAPSLTDLYLSGNNLSTVLDLALINFNGSQFPDFIGSLTNLRYLSLSSCYLVGQIPSLFRKLTQLQHLDLSYNQLQAENLNWLPAPSLTDLILSGNNLSTVFDFALINFNGSQFPDFIGSLTNLRYLSLSSCNLVGQIPSSFGNLKQLQHLYLGDNQLQAENLNWLGNLTQLQHLDLAYNQLKAENLNWLGNLTQLQYLDLTYNQLQAENLNWLPVLSSLTYLDLSGANLSTIFDWPEAVLNKLPKLVELQLTNCSLPPPPTPILSTTLYKTDSSTSLAYVHLSNNHLTSSIFLWLSNYSTSLVFLDLSNNNLAGFIPDFTRNMSSLVDLDLSNNYLTGFIPDFTGNMSSLVDLDLSYNNLTGFIPDFIGNMSSLVDLDLSDNQIKGANPNSFARLCNLQSLWLETNHLSGQLSKFVQLLPRCAQNSLEVLLLSENVLAGSLNNLTSFSSLTGLYLNANQLSGKIPESIGQMSQLEDIDFSINSLEGVVSETHFSKLSKLKYLDLSSNSLVLNFHSDWVPPFQLDYINLASCKVGPVFPKWLQTQKDSFQLDISNAGISDILPSWFWRNFRNAAVINLSQNLIRGIFTNLTVEFTYNLELHLRSNQIEGPIPSTLLQASYLDLSNNKISGSLSFLCESAYMNLTFLNLSSNNFYGNLPDCWSHLVALVMLDLSYNAFSEKIPMTIGSLWRIETLKLRSNKFVGELPSSLKNCTRLQVIDLGDNELSGSIPKWIGVSLKNLVILMLSSNHFNGSMPSQLCYLTRIQILDFSVNNISGSIPKCLNNLTNMAQKRNSSLTSTHTYSRDHDSHHRYMGDINYDDEASFIWKGRMQTYKSTLGLVKRIDLSKQ